MNNPANAPDAILAIVKTGMIKTPQEEGGWEETRQEKTEQTKLEQRKILLRFHVTLEGILHLDYSCYPPDVEYGGKDSHIYK